MEFDFALTTMGANEELQMKRIKEGLIKGEGEVRQDTLVFT